MGEPACWGCPEVVPPVAAAAAPLALGRPEDDENHGAADEAAAAAGDALAWSSELGPVVEGFDEETVDAGAVDEEEEEENEDLEDFALLPSNFFTAAASESLPDVDFLLSLAIRRDARGDDE